MSKKTNASQAGNESQPAAAEATSTPKTRTVNPTISAARAEAAIIIARAKAKAKEEKAAAKAAQWIGKIFDDGLLKSIIAAANSRLSSPYNIGA